jgi:hypothetical protein
VQKNVEVKEYQVSKNPIGLIIYYYLYNTEKKTRENAKPTKIGENPNEQVTESRIEITFTDRFFSIHHETQENSMISQLSKLNNKKGVK